MEQGHCVDRVSEVASASAVVAKHTPVLQASDRVLDPGAPPAMSTPCSITDDPVPAKDRCYQLVDAAIATVCEHATVFATQLFDT